MQWPISNPGGRNFDADSFKQFLISILKRAKPKKKILLVLDNARDHPAKKLKEFTGYIKGSFGIILFAGIFPVYKCNRNALEKNKKEWHSH